jgi:RimJ/RimL family protein N-acetyltransferase
MELLPINEHLEENPGFVSHPDCQDSLYMTIAFYKKIGFNPPWIGYYASIDGQLVGAAAYKGKPVNGQVEIAYGTFPAFQQKGIGTAICGGLVKLAQQTDPSVRITARTLPEENFSVKILRRNGFEFAGEVMDEEDGLVWEWVYTAI